MSRAAVEGYFAAINSDSFADLADVFAPEVEIHTVGAEPVVGREAALAHFPVVLSGYATHDDHVTRWISGVDDGSADAIVCDIAFSGTLTDGREIRFDALDVFDVHDGLITRVTTWYDTRLVARQVRG
ncbi:SnoaL-like protein [Pseudonocardia sediminis]|uniref:SnoaL-like protein n=1 Tax=Pseudonocardia sediminis TaxID=1397368 RepID=A0A4Q7UTZ2_PSEST|nr:nuclear transport factor 2 family protein [Pseudonocardia sediminis]RZT84484.1 SnoaL-like protein [Pseudonocardia sediminis]